MEINWKVIQEKLLAYCRSAYAENNIVMTPDELQESVLLFRNFVGLTLPYQEIGGIRQEMMGALQDACVDNVGDLSTLKTIATLIDTFLKKLIAYTGIDTFANVKDLTQMPLLKRVGLWGTTIPVFNDGTIESFRGNGDATYILGMAILTRNNVHLSPSWDDSEVTRRLKYVVAFYIYVVYQFKTQLLSREPNLVKQDLNYFKDNEENALLYDYISYGNSSIEIKKRYVNTFTKHQLYRHNEIEEKDLLNRMKDFSDNSLTDAAAKRLLVDLEKSGAITSKLVPKRYLLTPEELDRIQKAEDNYNEAILNFNDSMSEVLTRYGVTMPVNEVVDLLTKHISSVYNYDIEEAIGSADSPSQDNYQTLIDKLVQSGCPVEQGINLYKELLCINRDNDIIVRISAGKAFRSITNPEQFNEYVRKADRQVWLDTQILLYLLCYNVDYSTYRHPMYKTAMTLFRQPATNNYFHFNVANFYINELIYQLRQAVLLIPVVDLPFTEKVKMSNNVFYRHYKQLHDEDGLPHEVETFADYMENNFYLSESDAFEPDFAQIAEGVIEDKLREFHIKIEQMPTQSSIDINNSETLFVEAAKTLFQPPKRGKTLSNDAWMGVSLFKHNEEQKPIFITLDGCFEQYRRSYIKRYKRGQSFNWHLFSPSSFVNHIDFIDFKVSADNLTDDLISMIETTDVKDKTISVIDQFNRFLDIPQISSGQRKKYIKWVSDLFQSEEFSYKSETETQDTNPSIKRFMDAQDNVFTYFHDKDDAAMKNFLRMLQNEDLFLEYIYNLKQYASTVDANLADLYTVVESALLEFLNPTASQEEDEESQLMNTDAK